MRLALAALAALLLPLGAAAQDPALARAHAHNDYVRARPLADALERGVGSVEVDVHLVGGALLVAHHRDSVEWGRTLAGLYLDPLRARVRQHGGRVYPGGAPLVLLIDVKSEAGATYAALHETLGRYADVLTRFDGDGVTAGPVVAVVSGNRALAAMRAAPVRYAAVDGRLEDLARGVNGPNALPAALAPLVSDKWERVTRWRGDGRPPAALRDTLARLVDRARAQGRRLRFWGTPDREAVWQLLYDVGVDLIGADDLDRLRDFLARQEAGALGVHRR